MALTTLPTAALANDAVDNTKLNLADNYAFTGSVSGAGKVLQVVSSNEDGGISTSSQTYVTTSQSLSITPSSSSNKVLVLFDCGTATLAANTGMEIEIRRAGTAIAVCGVYTATVSGNLSMPCNTSVLDSPNTTSATTFEVFFKETGLAGSVNLYRRRLHLLEVQG
jgi:dihydroxyacetone kinase DhaKLM complex PTS-EIIA-like component DhaM